MKRKLIVLSVTIIVLLTVWIAYTQLLAPTKILVVNAADAQQADFILNNDSRHIRIDCIETEDLKDADGYDAIVLYGRNLYLNEEQTAMLTKAGDKGTVVFTKNARPSNPQLFLNISDQQREILKQYFSTATARIYVTDCAFYAI